MARSVAAGSQFADFRAATRSAATVLIPFLLPELENPRDASARVEPARSALLRDRLAARVLLHIHPESGHRDDPADARRDGGAVPAHRETDPLDDHDAEGAAGDQKDPGEVQGRQDQAE